MTILGAPSSGQVPTVWGPGLPSGLDTLSHWLLNINETRYKPGFNPSQPHNTRSISWSGRRFCHRFEIDILILGRNKEKPNENQCALICVDAKLFADDRKHQPANIRSVKQLNFFLNLSIIHYWNDWASVNVVAFKYQPPPFPRQDQPTGS